MSDYPLTYEQYEDLFDKTHKNNTILLEKPISKPIVLDKIAKEYNKMCDAEY